MKTQDAPTEASGGIRSLQVYWDLVQQSRQNLGKIPSPEFNVSEYARANFASYGYKTAVALNNALENKDFEIPNKIEGFQISNVFFDQRMDGTALGQAKRKGEKDYYAYSDLYLKEREIRDAEGKIYNPSGFYLTLQEDGKIAKIPFDLAGQGRGSSVSALTPLVEAEPTATTIWFPNQASIPFQSVSFEERWAYRTGYKRYLPQKKNGIFDNGGPESLLHLSRRLNFPSIYGIDRETLWQIFDPAQPEFTLQQVNAGAKKLGLDTQVEKINLSDLEKTASPALLFLKDDKRIVALTALDDDHAVVVDRGLTRIVKRGLLEERYSGEALTSPQSKPSVIAENGVREITLNSYEDESSQQVTLRNVSTQTANLQLEYPLLGVTDASLSKETLAPNETAILNLKMKWRSIFSAPYQNVLVSLFTGENQPRVQLAFLLTPPAGLAAPGRKEAAQLPRAEDDPNVAIAVAEPTVKVGQPAPDFTAVDMNGKVWKLSDLKGKKNVLLTFFPKCFTGGCANHLSSLRDRQEIFDNANTQILAVSVDPADGEKGQKEFARRWKFQFPLIPDTERKLSFLYGAAQKPDQLAARMTILINQQGIVEAVDTDVNVRTHGADIITKMRQLNMIK